MNEPQDSQQPDPIDDCFRRLFATADGKRVLDHLAERGLVLVASHIPGDPYETAWRDGRKSLVLEILHILRSKSSAELNAMVRRAEEEASRGR